MKVKLNSDKNSVFLPSKRTAKNNQAIILKYSNARRNLLKYGFTHLMSGRIGTARTYACGDLSGGKPVTLRYTRYPSCCAKQETLSFIRWGNSH